MYQILLVDDEIKITEWMKKNIPWSKYGFAVCEICTGGMQAVNYLENHKVDLIITDIRMPGLGGLELIKKINECRPGIRTLILSGYNQFEYAQQAIKYGVKGFLLKPLDPGELCDLLKELARELSGQNLSTAPEEAPGDLSAYMEQDENKIDAVIEYINKNYNKDICIKTCADLFEFHPAYLGKKIKDTTGVSFNTYLNKKRISQLKKLLIQSNLPISNLLESVGYHNYEYFYTVFKKYEGIPFSEYRANLPSVDKP